MHIRKLELASFSEPGARGYTTERLKVAIHYPETTIDKSNIFYTAVNPQTSHLDRMRFVEQVPEDLSDDLPARIILHQYVRQMLEAKNAKEDIIARMIHEIEESTNIDHDKKI